MATKKQDYQIPFDDEGNLMSYPSQLYKRDEDGNQRLWAPNFRTNYEFEATLTYDGYDNGIRSAHRVIWKDEEGHTYPMFISQLAHALETHGMVGTTMPGLWTVMKQGQNFSICAVKPDKPKKVKKGPVKQPKKVGKTLSPSAVTSLLAERDHLQTVIDTWDKVVSEVVAGPIYAHIAKRVVDKTKKA